MINEVVIGGRLTADPELRRTSAGIACTTFRIACERDYKPKDSDGSVVDYVDCVTWRSTAEFVAKYFSKGRMIICKGAIQQREFTNRDGEKRQKHEINVEKCWFGDSKRDGNRSDAAAAPTYSYEPENAPVPEEPSDFAMIDEEDGQLPF